MSYLCDMQSEGYTLIGAVLVRVDQLMSYLGDVQSEGYTLVGAVQVRVDQLMSYLCDVQSEGYTLIGAEQTVNGRSLQQFQFPKKTVLILGFENVDICLCKVQVCDCEFCEVVVADVQFIYCYDYRKC